MKPGEQVSDFHRKSILIGVRMSVHRGLGSRVSQIVYQDIDRSVWFPVGIRVEDSLGSAVRWAVHEAAKSERVRG